eukprot:13621658-Alexandrium_andersonii.AAC.1
MTDAAWHDFLAGGPQGPLPRPAPASEARSDWGGSQASDWSAWKGSGKGSAGASHRGGKGGWDGARRWSEWWEEHWD